MASTFKAQFEIPKKYNTWALALMAVGVLAIIILFITTRSTTVSAEELQRLKMTADEYNAHRNARFWASLLQNSVYFLLTVNAVMFFIAATTLAWGGFQMSFRRVSEAIATCIPVVGVIAFVIMMVL